MTVVFQNEKIGAREIMLAFGLLNGNEVTFNAEYTLSVLVDALNLSDRELDTFSLLHNESASCELSGSSRTDFNTRYESRFIYVSESPVPVTAGALSNVFEGVDDSRLRPVEFMSRLREFRAIGLGIGCDDPFMAQEWSHSLEPIVAVASRLEVLSISPWVKGDVRGDSPQLNLSYVLGDPARFSCLRYVRLEHFNSPGPLLVALFAGCSRTLASVALLCVRVSSSGSWSEVFRKLRNADFNVLYKFILLQCGEAKGAVRAQRYLKRITDKDPIAECNETQNDNSGQT